jgi:hypothetical protein
MQHECLISGMHTRFWWEEIVPVARPRDRLDEWIILKWI